VERAADVLASREAAARPVEAFPDDPEEGVAYLVMGSVEAGFEIPEALPGGRGLALLSEAEFYGRAAGIDSRQVKRLASRRKNVVDPLQLRAGDYVVHQTHGIGRFVELVQREVASGTAHRTRTARHDRHRRQGAARLPGDRVRAEQARHARATSSTCPPISSTC
jgi:transcription-repair coupling factor